MRLAFVNSAWAASWGGGEKWTVEAADWFRAQGHEIIVVGRPRSKLIAAAQGRNLPVVEFHFGGDFDPFATARAKRILSEHQVELAIVNFNKEAWLFGRAARKLKIPLVARHGFPLLRNTLHHRRLVEHLITRLVVNAQAIKAEYAQSGFDVSDVRIIHNGVAFMEQRRGELRKRFDISPDNMLILAAGRIESQKRFDRVLEIAQAITPTHPQIKLLIAGEGPDRESLEQQINERCLNEFIRFTGFIPDLAEIIADADLFLLTSDQEGTPNVLLEAMAAGVPCVSFAVGSVPEILTDDLSHYAIPAGDVVKMTERVIELLKNSSLRERVSKQMREQARTEFELNSSMQKFEHLFEETLRG